MNTDPKDPPRDPPCSPAGLQALEFALAELATNMETSAFARLDRLTIQDLRSLAAGYGSTAYYYNPDTDQTHFLLSSGEQPMEGWYPYDTPTGIPYPPLSLQEDAQLCIPYHVLDFSPFIKERYALIKCIMASIHSDLHQQTSTFIPHRNWIQLTDPEFSRHGMTQEEPT